MRPIAALRMRNAGVAPPVWTPSTLPALTTQSTAYANSTLGTLMKAGYLALPCGRIRFTLKGGTSEGLTVTSCYVGVWDGVANFFGMLSSTQVFWGGSPGVTAGIGVTTAFCDTITLPMTAGQGLVMKAWTVGTATAADNYSKGGGSSNAECGFQTGNVASSTSAAGYTGNGNLVFFDDLETSP